MKLPDQRTSAKHVVSGAPWSHSNRGFCYRAALTRTSPGKFPRGLTVSIHEGATRKPVRFEAAPLVAMQLGLDALEAGNLEIEPSLGSSGLVLKLRGACDAFAVTPLGGYLIRVFTEIERQGATEVTFDIRGLSLLNSSCLKQFITFLHKLRSLPTDEKYTVDFLVDAKLHWQSRALAAFVRMCPDIVRVIRVGAGDASNHAENA